MYLVSFSQVTYRRDEKGKGKKSGQTKGRREKNDNKAENNIAFHEGYLLKSFQGGINI